MLFVRKDEYKNLEVNEKMERIPDIKTFDVEEYTIGAREGAERIIFADKEQMREAKQELEDGQDIEVRMKSEHGRLLVITVSHKMIRNKLYIGEIQLCARDKKGGE